jgi:hypothetical protein
MDIRQLLLTSITVPIALLIPSTYPWLQDLNLGVQLQLQCPMNPIPMKHANGTSVGFPGMIHESERTSREL